MAAKAKKKLLNPSEGIYINPVGDILIAILA
jgi:hypothetical protein